MGINLYTLWAPTVSEKDKRKNSFKKHPRVGVNMVTRGSVWAFVGYLVTTQTELQYKLTRIVIHTWFLQCMCVSHQPSQRFSVPVEDLYRQVVTLLLLHYPLL